MLFVSGWASAEKSGYRLSLRSKALRQPQMARHESALRQLFSRQSAASVTALANAIVLAAITANSLFMAVSLRLAFDQRGFTGNWQLPRARARFAPITPEEHRE
jgi:hypothetical protein